jgi:hypothetical protein
MGGHDEILSRHFFPQQGSRRGHWLCRPVQNHGINFHELEGRNQLQDRGATTCNLGIRELRAQAKAI